MSEPQVDSAQTGQQVYRAKDLSFEIPGGVRARYPIKAAIDLCCEEHDRIAGDSQRGALTTMHVHLTVSCNRGHQSASTQQSWSAPPATADSTHKDCSPDLKLVVQRKEWLYHTSGLMHLGIGV
jgi:hypothetical protein